MWWKKIGSINVCFLYVLKIELIYDFKSRYFTTKLVTALMYIFCNFILMKSTLFYNLKKDFKSGFQFD